MRKSTFPALALFISLVCAFSFAHAQKSGGIAPANLKKCADGRMLPPEICCSLGPYTGGAPLVPPQLRSPHCPAMRYKAAATGFHCFDEAVQHYAAQANPANWGAYRVTLVRLALQDRCQRYSDGTFGPECLSEQYACMQREQSKVEAAIDGIYQRSLAGSADASVAPAARPRRSHR